MMWANAAAAAHNDSPNLPSSSLSLSSTSASNLNPTQSSHHGIPPCGSSIPFNPHLSHTHRHTRTTSSYDIDALLTSSTATIAMNSPPHLAMHQIPTPLAESPLSPKSSARNTLVFTDLDVQFNNTNNATGKRKRLDMNPFENPPSSSFSEYASHPSKHHRGDASTEFMAPLSPVKSSTLSHATLAGSSILSQEDPSIRSTSSTSTASHRRLPVTADLPTQKGHTTSVPSKRPSQPRRQQPFRLDPPSFWSPDPIPIPPTHGQNLRCHHNPADPTSPDCVCSLIFDYCSTCQTSVGPLVPITHPCGCITFTVLPPTPAFRPRRKQPYIKQEKVSPPAMYAGGPWIKIEDMAPPSTAATISAMMQESTAPPFFLQRASTSSTSSASPDLTNIGRKVTNRRFSLPGTTSGLYPTAGVQMFGGEEGKVKVEEGSRGLGLLKGGARVWKGDAAGRDSLLVGRERQLSDVMGLNGGASGEKGVGGSFFFGAGGSTSGDGSSVGV